MSDKITRIAIVDANRCKPKRCAQECKKVRRTVSGQAASADSAAVVSGGENGCGVPSYGTGSVTEHLIGKLCIEVKSSDRIAFISEFLCIGCGICVKK